MTTASLAALGSRAGRAQRWRRSLPETLAATLCLATLLAAARVSTVVFDRLPHVEDEVAFLFQARTIASGRLVAPAPAHPEFFAIPFILVRDGRWFGKFPPGWPAVLALGALAGRPWLVNPLLAAACVGLAYRAGRRLYGAPTGLLAAALLAASPFFLLHAGSFMGHVAALLWALAFLLLFAAAVSTGSRWAALGAGAALGMLFLTRPLTAVGIGLPYALWAAVATVRDRQRARAYLPMLVGCAPFVAALLAWNRLTTGDPLRSAYELYWSFDRVGFGAGIGAAGEFTVAQGLVNTRGFLAALADYTFGWPYRLSLVPAALATALAAGRLGRRGARRLWGGPGGNGEEPTRVAGSAATPPESWDLLHVGVAASLVAVHVAYWNDVTVYGPRYYFEALGALALLSARGLVQIADLAAALLRRAAPAWRRPRAWSAAASGCPAWWRPRAWTAAAALLIAGGLTLHGLITFAPREFRRFTRFYNIDGSGVRAVRAAGLTNAVVFVASPQQPDYAWPDYAPFFCQNAPTLDSMVVYAEDLGDARNRQLMAQYPGRAFYRYAQGRLAPLPP
jgi:4-amino-4-deoxy-L-arabinose transferase-like glycosyltransferase